MHKRFCGNSAIRFKIPNTPITSDMWSESLSNLHLRTIKKIKILVLKETDYFLCNIFPPSSSSLLLPDLTAIQMRWFCCTLNWEYDLYLETPLKNIFFCQFAVTALNNKRDY